MPSPNRRTFVKGLTSALALGAVGSAAGHPSDEEHPSFSSEHAIHRHDVTKNAGLVGYHSIGDIGSESTSGQPDDALYGMLTDVWVEGDLGFVSMQTSSAPTGNRGVAILDVSPYTRAESKAEAEDAEMTVLSFIGNETEAGTANDVKVSNDKQILAYSKQAIGTLYGEPASASTDTHSAPGAEPQGVIAYDISDPQNPEYIGSATGPNVGFHNCFVHQIGGDYYVFGIQGAIPGSAAVHVYRVTEAGLEPIDIWGGDDLPVTSLGTEGASYYCHDFYAHDDPVSGRPLGFIAYWNYGGVVLDLSDPRNITALGRGGGMPRTHYVQPAPAEVGGKRLLVGGQEHGDQTNDISGEISVWDVDAIVEGDGFTEVDPLATYTLYDKVTYDGYAFSPHNNDIIVDGDGDTWIAQGHYHAGIRFLKVEPPGEGEVNTDEWHIAGRLAVGAPDASAGDVPPVGVDLALSRRLDLQEPDAGVVVGLGDPGVAVCVDDDVVVVRTERVPLVGDLVVQRVRRERVDLREAVTLDDGVDVPGCDFPGDVVVLAAVFLSADE